MVEQYKQIPTKYESTNDVDECQILGGIDTLYFFVDTNSDLAPTKLYQNLWLEVNNGSFFRDGYTFLNFSGKKMVLLVVGILILAEKKYLFLE